VINGLDNLLADTRQPGLPELRQYLASLFATKGESGRIVEVSKLLRARVFRVRVEMENSEQSLVIKRLTPDLAFRERRVIEKWLPRIGLDGLGPPLLGSVADNSGRCIWHVYEDLGPWTLDKHLDNASSVLAATQLVAELHQRSALHPQLAECRAGGGDFSIWFYDSSIRDAIRALEAIQSAAIYSTPRCRKVVLGLLERLRSLREESSFRAEIMAEYGGPETIVHGDLWTTNIFVMPGEGKPDARLIDWDHIGVGQAAYDLSTYLFRFPAERRQEILDQYQAAIAPNGCQIPPQEHFNTLCETAEYSRLANAVVWSALPVPESDSEWAVEELEEIERWFDTLKPILPVSETYDRALRS
jgi:thiamine kinase-like enzyme